MCADGAPGAIRRLEQELGLYQPAGDNLNECPRCGGVSVLVHVPDARFGPPLCAMCAINVLDGLGWNLDESYRAKLWECCTVNGGRHCMNGCVQSLKRREATSIWTQQQRRLAETLALDSDFKVIEGTGRTYRMLKTPVADVLARHEREDVT